MCSVVYAKVEEQAQTNMDININIRRDWNLAAVGANHLRQSLTCM